MPVHPARASDGIGVQTGAGPHFEVWTGAQAFDRAWSLYSGVSFAPFGSIEEDGARLRAAGGYGSYSLAGGPGRGTVSFADLLVGYHKQLGPLTLKVLGGLTLEDHDLPDRKSTPDFGAKAVLEGWWNVSDQLWTALDLSRSTLEDAYAARLRLGWRLVPEFSAGLEAGAFGNADCDVGRIGAFVRYEWARGELYVSGGLSSSGASASEAVKMGSGEPFATVSWLARF